MLLVVSGIFEDQDIYWYGLVYIEDYYLVKEFVDVVYVVFDLFVFVLSQFYIDGFDLDIKLRLV